MDGCQCVCPCRLWVWARRSKASENSCSCRGWQTAACVCLRLRPQQPCLLLVPGWTDWKPCLPACTPAHRPIEKQMSNLECNAVSAVQITHLLLTRMRAKKLRGCFVYTSSGACNSVCLRVCPFVFDEGPRPHKGSCGMCCKRGWSGTGGRECSARAPCRRSFCCGSTSLPAAAAMIPNPFSVLYASTKSFLSCELLPSFLLCCLHVSTAALAARWWRACLRSP
jgi:hypothetical protein